MFFKILLFEFRHQIRRPLVWIFSLALFIQSFVILHNTDPYRTIVIRIGQGWHNSPHVITLLLGELTVIGLLFSTVIAGDAIYKDFQARSQEFIFSSPVSKAGYFFGRFVGAFAVNLLLFLAPLAAVAAAAAGVEGRWLGPWGAAAFAAPFLLLAVPNVLFTASLSFLASTLSRRIVSTYVAGAVCFFVYTLLRQRIVIGSEALTAWLDPFGLRAYQLETRYWTVAQQNVALPSIHGIFVGNRLLWTSLSAILLCAGYRLFRMQALPAKLLATAKATPGRARAQIRVWPRGLTPTLYEFRRVALHPAFLVLLAVALQVYWRALSADRGANGSVLLPIGSSLYGSAIQALDLPLTVITILYAGLLVWRERDERSAGILWTTPVSTTSFMASRVLALWLLQTVFVVAIAIEGLTAQRLAGFAGIDWRVLIGGFGAVWLAGAWMLGALCIFIQTLSPNKYAGFFASAMFCVVMGGLKRVGFGNPLYRFGEVPPHSYTDFTGFAPFTGQIVSFRIYWLIFTALLLILTARLWVRHLPDSTAAQISRMTIRNLRAPALVLIAFAATGALIARAVSVPSADSFAGVVRGQMAIYENEYTRFAAVHQPVVRHVSLAVDLQPREQKAHVRGAYILENPSDEPVSTIFVTFSRLRCPALHNLSLNRSFRKGIEDNRIGFYSLELESPLVRGAEATLSFDYSCFNGAPGADTPTEIVSNGTAMADGTGGPRLYFPAIGYQQGMEVRGRFRREARGLPPEPWLEGATPPQWVTYEATITTDPDQTAITLGELLDSGYRNRRAWFRYRSVAPVHFAPAIVSGRFEKREEQVGDVRVQLYYHPGHEFNLRSVLAGARRSLEYCGRNFGAYPYKTLKIAEVPAFHPGGTAFAMPGLIVWLDQGGLLSDLKTGQARDVVFNTAAHEVAHQWWGHRVAGSGPGAGVLSETMAQYVRLMAMRDEFGPEELRRFVRDETGAYFMARTRELEEEQPLSRTSQPYVIYQKGSVVMYSLQRRLGEGAVNRALRSLVERFGFKPDVQPAVSDLIMALRREGGAANEQTIHDSFDRIVVLEGSIENAAARSQTDGTYIVSARVAARKLESDGRGTEREIGLDDYIDLVVRGNRGVVLAQGSDRTSTRETEIVMKAPRRPVDVLLDPTGMWRDRNPGHDGFRIKD